MSEPLRPPPSAMASRVFGLDALRAAAILGVVLTHLFVLLYSHMPPSFGLLGHGGFYGVELFFVLSGFLIGRILLRVGNDLERPSELARFYLRRWFRTLPLFWLFLLVNVALEFFLHHRALTLSDILGYGFFLRSFANLRLDFFGESWSLAIEEWFYLLFPAVLFLGLRLSRRFGMIFLVAAGVFFSASTVGRMIYATAPNSNWATAQRMIVVLRFDALMFGVMAAWISLRYPRAWRARPKSLALAGIVLLFALYCTLWKVVDHRWAFGDDDYFARTFRFTFVSLGFALLLPFASSWRLRRENFLARNIRRIALWSYALYLVHLPLFLIVTASIFRDWKTSAVSAFSSFALQLLLAFSLSGLLFHFYESPCTRLRDKAAPAFARLLRRSRVDQAFADNA